MIGAKPAAPVVELDKSAHLFADNLDDLIWLARELRDLLQGVRRPQISALNGRSGVHRTASMLVSELELAAALAERERGGK